MILNSPTISGSLTVTGNTVLSGSINVVGGLTGTASFASTAISSSYSATAISSSYALASTSASYALASTSASYGLNALTSSNSMTASSADTLYVRNNATVLGSITAQTLVVQTVTSSVLFTTGSNKIGSSLSNVQELTGSVGITGSFTANGVGTFASTIRVNGGELQIYNGAPIAYAGVDTGNSYVYYGTNTSNYGVSLQASGERMYISASGNVGIGTNTPATLLTLYRNASEDNRLSIYQGTNGYASAINLLGNDSAGAAYNYINSGTSGGVLMWQIGGGGVSNTMILYTSGSERMRITSAGNVGIGTTSPGEKLEVSGNIKLGGTATYNSVLIYNSGSSGGGGVLCYQNGVAQAFIGALAWYTGGTSTGAVIGTDNANNPIVFYTSAERMRITGAGNVGIGTTSPDAYASTFLQIHSSGGNSALRLTNSTSGTTKDDGADIELKSDNLFIATRETSTSIVLATQATERMRITSTGDVGINTTARVNGSGYSNALSIKAGSTNTWGLVEVRGSSTTTGGEVHLGGDTAIYAALVGEYVSANNGNLYIRTLRSGTITNAITVTSTGNVGIGISTPPGSHMLQINNPGQNYCRVNMTNTSTGTSNSDGLIFQQELLNSIIKNQENGYLAFGVNSSESNLVIAQGGNVLIGSATDQGGQYKLQIGGSGDTNLLLYSSTGAYSSKINLGTGGAGGVLIEKTGGGTGTLVVRNESAGVYLSNGATSWASNSDERIKDIDSNIENAVSMLSSLRTVKYSWKSDQSKKLNLGLIAQDVIASIPEAVDTQSDELGTLGVRYTELIPVLVAAIKEQQAKIEALEEKLQRNNIE